MSDPPDDLVEILAPRDGQLTAERRAGILVETERRLTRDRMLRRGLRLAAVAGVFAVGAFAGWAARPVPEPERVQVTVTVPVPVHESLPSVPVSLPLSAHDAELRAELQDDPSAAARLYREAGDVFLREQNYPNATRCYRLFLQRGGEAVLALESNDSWLLVSLKNSAFKEKAHATKNDG